MPNERVYAARLSGRARLAVFSHLAAAALAVVFIAGCGRREATTTHSDIAEHPIAPVAAGAVSRRDVRNAPRAGHGARAGVADADDIEIGLPGSARVATPIGDERTQPTELTTENTKMYPNEEYQASIVQILAHRDRYDGKEVQIEGFLEVEFEGTAIYLSKDDADYGITRNGFWVTFDGRAVPYKKGSNGPTQYHRKYVLIEGTFDKDLMGHCSLWQGTIKNVNRIVELTKHK
jgi:hypothetical protein